MIGVYKIVTLVFAAGVFWYVGFLYGMRVQYCGRLAPLVRWTKWMGYALGQLYTISAQLKELKTDATTDVAKAIENACEEIAREIQEVQNVG